MDERERGGELVPRIVSRFVKSLGKTGPFELPGGVTNAQSMLFVDSGDVVDLLFAAPVVNYFAARYPHVKSTILVRSVDAELVKGLMRVNLIISYEPKQIKLYSADYLALLRKLRGKRFGATLCLGRRFDVERHLLAFATGAPVRVGLAHPLAYPFVNCEVRVADGGYEGKKLTRVLPALGLRLEPGWDEIALVARDIQHARQLKHFWKPERDLLMVGLDPSAGKTRHHVIPEIIAYLANNLASRRRAKFVVFGNPWDDKLARALAQDLRGEILDLKPQNPVETIALLSQCDLFLSGNTNLFHFAAALRVPTIGCFTRYDRQGWIPDAAPTVRIMQGARGEKLSLKDFFALVEEALAARPQGGGQPA